MRDDLTGEKYNRLTVKSFSHCDRHYNPYWNCLCDCGNRSIVVGHNLKSGHTGSCGCLSKVAHGMYRTPTYKSWENMIQRCENSNRKGYHRYGGRGISVCSRWKNSYSNFFVDMGEKPEGLTIERIDNNGNYEPSNCKWATWIEQANNRCNNINKL